MKRIILLSLSLILLVTNAKAEEIVKKVYINQFVQHPALDATTKGIIDGLGQSGYKQGKNLDLRIESAQSNSALAAQIASKFINQNPDIVVGVATISAQSFIKYTLNNKAKLVFSSVTDPLAAGLIKNINQPSNNTSGVSNFVELEPQIQLFKKIQQNIKQIGFIYNPAEINSVSLIKQLEEICPRLGIKLVLQAVSKTSDVPQAATKILNNVDAIFISNDSTALSALKSIVVAANKAKKPVYVSDTDAVELGALAALGPNQYEIGIQTAKIITRALKGEDIGNIAVEFPHKTELYINEDAAKILDIKIPDEIKSEAVKIISNNKDI
ncbi:MAG: ABC transporter substrate-binding protein [Alphaproteobacteria bacterium]